MKHERAGAAGSSGPSGSSSSGASGKEEGLGVNIRSIVIVAVLMMLMMFAVHCTWVTSNAYSSPSIVLASYRPDGWGHFGFEISVRSLWSHLAALTRQATFSIFFF